MRPTFCTILLAVSAAAVAANPPVSEQQRTGYPQQIAPWAIPSNTPAYSGYYLGGGALSLRKGEPRTPEEGTWGWDYFGRHFRRRVDLLWWHGRRYQGGSGAYQTDGPRLLPP